MKVKVIFLPVCVMRSAPVRKPLSWLVMRPLLLKCAKPLIAKGEAWAHAFRNLKRIRAAVNQELAGDDAVVKEGDEVAFFPPVTGG